MNYEDGEVEDNNTASATKKPLETPNNVSIQEDDRTRDAAFNLQSRGIIKSTSSTEKDQSIEDYLHSYVTVPSTTSTDTAGPVILPAVSTSSVPIASSRGNTSLAQGPEPPRVGNLRDIRPLPPRNTSGKKTQVI